MQEKNPMQETFNELALDLFPSDIRKAIKSYKRNTEKIEKEQTNQRTHMDFIQYKLETQNTLNSLLDHSKTIQVSLDNEKKIAQKERTRANFFTWLSIILGILSLILGIIPLLR